MSADTACADTPCRQENAPVFVGWMLWNIVRTQHVSRGIAWPLDSYGGIFEDMPEDMQTAWNRAAADLQQRAKTFGRLI